MKRGVVALVLLAGGLLLLGGLLASVDPQDLAPTGMEAKPRTGDDAGDTDRLEEFVGAQAVSLIDDVEIEIPEGSSLEWDGETLQVLGNVTIKIPEGTSLENLTIALPKDTLILPTDGSEPGRRILLAPDTRVRLPEEHEAPTFRLPEGGELSRHSIPLRQQEEGIRQQSLRTLRFSILEAPRAVLEDEWRLKLDQDAQAELAAFAPIFDQMLDDQRAYSNETLTLSAEGATDESPSQTGDDGPMEAVLPAGPGAPPPWWAWMIVAGTVAAVALYVAARQVPTLLRRGPSPHSVALRLDDRPEGLPLASEPDRARTLQVALTHREDSLLETIRKDRKRKATLRIDLVAHKKLYKGRISDETLALDLPPLPAGDHEIKIRVRHRLFSRAHKTRQTLRVAPWDEQVARDYQGLLNRLQENRPSATVITPRRCRDLLEQLDRINGNDPAAIVKTFEEANYSPKNVEEDDWLPFALRVKRLQDMLRQGRPDRTNGRRLVRHPAAKTADPSRTTG